jgi:hypothetical protein
MAFAPVRERADSFAESTDAAFDEWVLQDVILKRTLMNGKATFQFHFDWDLCMRHGEETGNKQKAMSRQCKAHAVKRSTKRTFTPEEDQMLAQLKDRKELSWAEIHRRFCDKFPERSKDSLQVRYCTKLKRRDR